jgi:RadC-like JAB domain
VFEGGGTVEIRELPRRRPKHMFAGLEVLPSRFAGLDWAKSSANVSQAIIDIATPLGIAVHDHIIVGRGGHASLKGMRLI